MVAGLHPDRQRRLQKAHLQILQRPTPHVYPNLNLSNYVEIGPVGWRTWRRFRPGGLRSILGFLSQLVSGYGLTNAEVILLDHERLLVEERCHSWNDMGWCFCKEAES